MCRLICFIIIFFKIRKTKVNRTEKGNAITIHPQNGKPVNANRSINGKNNSSFAFYLITPTEKAIGNRRVETAGERNKNRRKIEKET